MCEGEPLTPKLKETLHLTREHAAILGPTARVLSGPKHVGSCDGVYEAEFVCRAVIPGDDWAYTTVFVMPEKRKHVDLDEVFKIIEEHAPPDIADILTRRLQNPDTEPKPCLGVISLSRAVRYLLANRSAPDNFCDDIRDRVAGYWRRACTSYRRSNPNCTVQTHIGEDWNGQHKLVRCLPTKTGLVVARRLVVRAVAELADDCSKFLSDLHGEGAALDFDWDDNAWEE